MKNKQKQLDEEQAKTLHDLGLMTDEELDEIVVIDQPKQSIVIGEDMFNKLKGL